MGWLCYPDGILLVELLSYYSVQSRIIFPIPTPSCQSIFDYLGYGLMKSSIISATSSCCSAKLKEGTISPF